MLHAHTMHVHLQIELDLTPFTGANSMNGNGRFCRRNSEQIRHAVRGNEWRIQTDSLGHRFNLENSFNLEGNLGGKKLLASKERLICSSYNIWISSRIFKIRIKMFLGSSSLLLGSLRCEKNNDAYLPLQSCLGTLV